MSACVIWFACAILFFIIEMATPFGVFLFAGVGALAASAAAWFTLDTPWQLGFFTLVTILSLLLFRNRLKAVFSGKKETADDTQHRMSGREGVASTDLYPGREGQVEIGGSYWRAQLSGTMPVTRGTPVTVLSSAPDDATLLLVQESSARTGSGQNS